MHDSNSTLVLLSHEQRQLDLLVKSWIASYAAPTTRRTYMQRLSDFMRWAISHQLDPLTMKRTHIDLFMRDMEARGLASATRSLTMTAVHQWYEWLIDEEVIVLNPCRRVKRPQRKDTIGRQALSRTHMTDLVAAAEAAGGDDYALVALLGLQGMRIDEACRAKLEHITEEAYWYRLTILGKGDKRRRITLTPQTMKAIDGVRDGRTEGLILHTQAGTPMVRAAAQRTLDRLCKAAKITRHVHPHLLRHTYATLALKAGVAQHDVQIALGHASSDTTMQYAQALQDSPERDPSMRVMQFIAAAA